MVTFFDEEITSKQNKHVKEAASLLSVKGRKEACMTRFDGIKLFLESVACGVRIDTVFLSSSKKEELLRRIDESFPDWRESLSANVITLSDAAFSAITEEKSPEGIICLVKYLDKSEKSGTIIRKEFENVLSGQENMPVCERTMALEAIRDPGNLGTIIRTCLAFGIERILLSCDCADVLSPKVIRSSMGAVFRAKLLVCENLCASLESLKKDGFRINAAALYGNPSLLSDTELSEKDIFVIGNEGHGLSDGVLSVAERCVIIDMEPGPGCESLNASAAAAICAWEQKRRCGSCCK